MSALTALFIGGTGLISSACGDRALERGIDLTVLNRGQTSTRPVPSGAEVLTADASDPESIRAALGDREFDVVVNFVSFVPEQATRDVDLFAGRVGQYVYISSASAYQKPPARLPILESTPLRNPFWQYSRDKIASEDVLVSAYRESGFPATIVRPSHTYDRTSMPLSGGWTMIDRMRRGKPVVLHGDGTSLWTMTHNTDFAKAFVGLLGNPQAVGDSFHITSDEVLTWNQIATQLATAAGVEPTFAYATSDAFATAIPDLGDGILGDKAHSVIFDNSKVKALVPDFAATTPFFAGAREIVEWHDEDPARRTVDADLDRAFDALAGS